MKKSGITTLVLAGLLMTFTACQEDSDDIGTDLDALELDSEAAMETTYEDVDQAVEVEFATFDDVRLDVAGRPECATVTHYDEASTLTIDYGDECEGPYGNVLSGKIHVEYHLRNHVPGSYRIVTFEDFYFNGISVEGTRKKENTSTVEGEREHTVTLTNGKLDFGDGTYTTREAVWKRTWFVGQGKVTKSGEASGINLNGIDYTSTVNAADPITYKRTCASIFPVSGVKNLTVGNTSSSIDFGDGRCDKLITVTTRGGSVELEINPRTGQGSDTSTD